MDLDSLLGASAPDVAPRSPALHEELLSLAEAAETSVRPRRRRRRIVIVGGAVAAVLGGTVATTAAVAPSSWTSWTSTQSAPTSAAPQTCRMHIVIEKAGPDVGNGAPNMWPSPFDAARRDRIVADAQAFVDAFDYAGIDRSAAIRSWRADEATAIALQEAHPASKPGEAPDAPQPQLTGDELVSTAITHWVLGKLDQHLTTEGYDMSSRKGADTYLMMDATASRCE